MRKLVVLVMLAIGSAADAAQCVTVTSSHRADMSEIGDSSNRRPRPGSSTSTG